MQFRDLLPTRQNNRPAGSLESQESGKTSIGGKKVDLVVTIPATRPWKRGAK